MILLQYFKDNYVELVGEIVSSSMAKKSINVKLEESRVDNVTETKFRVWESTGIEIQLQNKISYRKNVFTLDWIII